MEQWIVQVMQSAGQWGFLIILLLMAAENIFPPIPSEVVLTCAGFLTTCSELTRFQAILSATLGSLLGAVVLYGLGRALPVEKLSHLGFQPEEIEDAERWFCKRGKIAVLLCRCVPMVRSLISIPAGTRVLISEQTTVGKKNPYSREKLCPILAFYVEDDWHAACERCIEILNNEGVGHTMTIHSENKEVIRAFALRKPVSRLLVNVAAALGGVGATTSLPPALTLGCGAVGGSATSDNITPLNLMNIRRVAYGTKELSDLRGGHPAPDTAAPAASGSAAKLSASQIEAISQSLLQQLRG